MLRETIDQVLKKNPAAAKPAPKAEAAPAPQPSGNGRAVRVTMGSGGTAAAARPGSRSPGSWAEAAVDKSLDRKLAAIHADPHGCQEFILADAKDADMAFGIGAPGRSPEAHAGELRYRTPGGVPRPDPADRRGRGWSTSC